MTAAEVLDQAQAAGVTLWAEGDALRYRGPREVVAELLSELKVHKSDIVKALGQPPVSTATVHRLAFRRWATVR